jgi:hypothetical protein
LPSPRVIAARHQNDVLVVRRDANLVGENAGVEFVRLFNLVADAAVRINAMHREIGRIVVGDE